MKTFNCLSAAITAFVFFICLESCSTNNSANTVSKTSAYPRIIERASKDKRYFIMYSGVDTYRVTSVEVEKTKQQFTVRLAMVDSLHVSQLKTPATLTDKLIQMHMRDSASYTLDEPHTIPVSKVAKIDLSN